MIAFHFFKREKHVSELWFKFIYYILKEHTGKIALKKSKMLPDSAGDSRFPKRRLS